MIMDPANIHELTHKKIEGYIPAPRVYATGEMNSKFGAAYILGGRDRLGVPVCDMWSLDVELMIEKIESPDTVNFTNIWNYHAAKDKSEIFCRWGHSTAFIDTRYIFVIGGVNLDNMVVRDPFLYDMLDGDHIPLREEGDPPSVRLSFSNLLEAGNGMMTLYGGEDAGH